MNFAHALLFHTIRGETSEEDLQPLVEAGFCSKAEVPTLFPAYFDRIKVSSKFRMQSALFEVGNKQFCRKFYIMKELSGFSLMDLPQAAAVADKPEPFVSVLGWVMCILQVFAHGLTCQAFVD